MKKTPHEYHPDLALVARQTMPVRPKVIPLSQRIQSALYKKEKSDSRVTVSTLSIQAEDSAVLCALLYESRAAEKNCPCLIFYHGGGWAYQAAPYHFNMARRLTAFCNCRTLFVDYRLAPKYKFPIPVFDAFAAYRWALSNAELLSIDPARIALCGDSAGGNLSAAVSLMARDQGLPLPCGQVLLYPVTDCSMDTESMREFDDTPMCNNRDMAVFYDMYVADFDPALLPYLSPLSAQSHAGLPATYVETAEFDCLRDEGAAYARALEAAGVTVDLIETKNSMHGYDFADRSGFVRAVMEKRVAFLRRVMYG